MLWGSARSTVAPQFLYSAFSEGDSTLGPFWGYRKPQYQTKKSTKLQYQVENCRNTETVSFSYWPRPCMFSIFSFLSWSTGLNNYSKETSFKISSSNDQKPKYREEHFSFYRVLSSKNANKTHTRGLHEATAL